MNRPEFGRNFERLTGQGPFPWQEALYARFIGQIEGGIPRMASIPTGLGKTSVIAVWLLAVAKHPGMIPRRLVYVVNRRTVVDQTTREAENLKVAVETGKLPDIDQLAISTLRGQFADNGEWYADPTRPSVICGTVDMIGSRLLFEGYRIGFKSRPLHAGFLGQDSLLVHDEAHLEPAFQRLIESIQDEQKRERERNGQLPWPRLRVMALSATVRGQRQEAKAELSKPFELTDEEKEAPNVVPDPPIKPIHHVWRRLKAKKLLQLHPCDDEKKKLAEQIAGLAVQHQGKEVAVLIFVRKIDDVVNVVEQLKKKGASKGAVGTLTGTMRGYERDEVVRSSRVFARFMPPNDRARDVDPTDGAVYLVCTSAGEVGVNLSADHMVCDLSTFDSMAQRLGRVNRFGECNDTRIDVVHPASGTFDDKDKLTPSRQATLDLLQQLGGNASTMALNGLPVDQRLAAFAPEPTILPVTDILFDAWAMTTIKGKMPGRPPVAPYLHGVAEWEPSRTSVAWREEVEVITDETIEREGENFPQELLADYPIKAHELLSDRSDRVLAALQKMATDHVVSPVWLIDDQQQVRVSTLGKIADPSATKADEKRPLERVLVDSIILLPPSVGGLSAGMLDPECEHAEDVADQWLDENGTARRKRLFNDEPAPIGGAEGMALTRTIDLNPLADEFTPSDGGTEVDADDRRQSLIEGDGTPSNSGRFWHWYARPRDADDATRASTTPIKWQHHTEDVVEKAKQIVNALILPDDLKRAVILSAELHDLGKQREIWQRSIGNPNPTDWHAKPGKPDGQPRWRLRQISDYRHEFGSLLDALNKGESHAAKLSDLNKEMRDVVLHLIASHHGYARPHFPQDAYDYERHSTEQNTTAANEVMRRYGRLQRRYGRWGLAYLESLLRAADWAASAEPSKVQTEKEAAQ